MTTVVRINNPTRLLRVINAQREQDTMADWPWLGTATARTGERVAFADADEIEVQRALIAAGARLGTIQTYRVPPGWTGSIDTIS